MSTLSIAFAVVSVFAAASVHAASEPWEDRAEVRLVDGGIMEDGQTRLAGLEILLDPNWKTYWRSPGDSGIPPRIDFSESENVADVTFEWPAPEFYYDGYGWVIVYTDAVVFPLLVTSNDPTAPVFLKLKLDYAVCKDICIPAEAEIELPLDGKSARPSMIEFYRNRIPPVIDTPTQRGGIVSSSVTHEGEDPELELHVRLPGAADDAFAAVEGPEGWYLPVPERQGVDAEGNAIFRVSLGGAADPAAIAGTELRVTGVSPAYTFEQRITLD